MCASKKDHQDELELDIELSVQSSGRSGSDNKIYVEIKKSSSQFILNYSMSDTSQELGGVLLGDCIEKDGQYHVCVEEAIEARYTEAARGSVTFTHKTWEYINQVRDEKFPHHKVVGWFHTHPGFGIFLSGHDKFIHQNFFNLPWQIAYVVDPLAGQHGFFGWCNNSIEKIPFKAELSPEAVTAVKSLPVEEKVRSARFGWIAAAAAIIVLLFTSGYYFFSNQEANRRAAELETVLSEMEGNLSVQQNEIDSLLAAKRELELLKGSINSMDPLFSYTVSEGDTLWGISEQYLGDGERYLELAELNKLVNPDLLVTGASLLIPLKQTVSE